MIFHRQIQKIHPLFDCFDKETYLVQNLGHFASSEKGLTTIGSKMGMQLGFIFGHFLQTSISFISLPGPSCIVSPDTLVWGWVEQLLFFKMII